MTTNKDNDSVYDYIDEQIGDLLTVSLFRRHKKIEISKVIEILVEVEKRIPQIVVDGDELVKYFTRKHDGHNF
jgi:hypothetical protein